MHVDASMAMCDKESRLKTTLVTWTIFERKAIHINLSFTRSRKSKDTVIVGAEI